MRRLSLSAVEAGNELRLAAAVKLYKIGRLSSSAAAQLAGVPRAVFLSRLADFGVETFRQTEEELVPFPVEDFRDPVAAGLRAGRSPRKHRGTEELETALAQETRLG